MKGSDKMEWIACSECSFKEDCTDRENRDGCYFGEKETSNVTTYRNLYVPYKSLFITKNDYLYVQVAHKPLLLSIRKEDKITFLLTRNIRIYGTVSRISYAGFFVKDWCINKGEKFANEL